MELQLKTVYLQIIPWNISQHRAAVSDAKWMKPTEKPGEETWSWGLILRPAANGKMEILRIWFDSLIPPNYFHALVPQNREKQTV